MNRLLFMIRVPLPVAEEMAALVRLLRRGYGLGNWGYEAARLHITLLELGHHVDLPAELVAAASRAAATVRVAPFAVTFDRIEAWSDALVLRGEQGASSLAALRGRLGAALKQAEPAYKAAFTPHVSLLRGPTSIEPQQVRTFRWTVEAFALVNSLTGRSRYVELGRWPLRS